MRKIIKKLIFVLIVSLMISNINYISNAVAPFNDHDLAMWANGKDVNGNSKPENRKWFLDTDLYEYAGNQPAIGFWTSNGAAATIRIPTAACIDPDANHTHPGPTSYIMSSTIEIDNKEKGVVIRNYNPNNKTNPISREVIKNPSAIQEAAFLAAMVEDVSTRPHHANLKVIVYMNIHIFMKRYASDDAVKHMIALFGNVDDFSGKVGEWNEPWKGIYPTAFSTVVNGQVKETLRLSKKVMEYADNYQMGGGVTNGSTATPNAEYPSSGGTVLGPYKLIFDNVADLEEIKLVAGGKTYTTKDGTLKLQNSSGTAINLGGLTSNGAFYLKISDTVKKFDSITVRAKGGGTRAKIILFSQCAHQRISIFNGEAGTGNKGTELPLPVPVVKPVLAPKKYISKIERYNPKTGANEVVFTNDKVPVPVIKNAGTKDATVTDWNEPVYDDINNPDKFVDGKPIVYDGDIITYKWVIYNIGPGDCTSGTKYTLTDNPSRGLVYQGNGWTEKNKTEYTKTISINTKLDGYISGTPNKYQGSDTEIIFKVDSKDFFDNGGQMDSNNMVILKNNGVPVALGLYKFVAAKYIYKVERYNPATNGYDLALTNDKVPVPVVKNAGTNNAEVTEWKYPEYDDINNPEKFSNGSPLIFDGDRITYRWAIYNIGPGNSPAGQSYTLTDNPEHGLIYQGNGWKEVSKTEYTKDVTVNDSLQGYRPDLAQYAKLEYYTSQDTEIIFKVNSDDFLNNGGQADSDGIMSIKNNGLPVVLALPKLVSAKYVYQIERYNPKTGEYTVVMTNNKAPTPVVDKAGTNDADVTEWIYPEYDDINNPDKFAKGYPLVFDNDKITYKWAIYNIGPGDWRGGDYTLVDNPDYGLVYQGEGWTQVNSKEYKKDVHVDNLHGYRPALTGTKYATAEYYESKDTEITFKVSADEFFNHGGQADENNIVILENNGVPVIFGLSKLVSAKYVHKIERYNPKTNGYELAITNNKVPVPVVKNAGTKDAEVSEWQYPAYDNVNDPYNFADGMPIIYDNDRITYKWVIYNIGPGDWYSGTYTLEDHPDVGLIYQGDGWTEVSKTEYTKDVFVPELHGYRPSLGGKYATLEYSDKDTEIIFKVDGKTFFANGGTAEDDRLAIIRNDGLPVVIPLPKLVSMKYVAKVERYNHVTGNYDTIITNNKLPEPIVENAGTVDAELKEWQYPEYDDVNNPDKFVDGMPLLYNEDKITYKWVVYNIGAGNWYSGKYTLEDEAEYGLVYQGEGWTVVSDTEYTKEITVPDLHGYRPNFKGSGYDVLDHYEDTVTEITFKIDVKAYLDHGGQATSDNLIIIKNNGLPIAIKLDIRGMTFIDKLKGKLGENGYWDDGTDEILKDVNVYLYTKDNPNTPYVNNVGDDWKNPTNVDDNGRYEFKRVDPTKEYFVRFEYNGMYYMPTTYDVQENIEDPNKPIDYILKSYASEKPEDRANFNKKFEVIDAGMPDSMKTYPETPAVVDPFKMSAYTGSTDGERTVFTLNCYDITMQQYVLDNVNLGVIERPKFDISATKDGIEFKVTVNDVSTTYIFDALNNRVDQALEVDLKGADLDPYVRYLRKADLADIDENTGGPSLKMELKYKIKVKNTSPGALTAKINTVRDWFDKDLELKSITVDGQNVSGTQGNAGNYKYVDINKEITLMSGENASMEITFDVNSQSVIDKLTSGANPQGIVENNFTEIQSYSNYHTFDERDLNDVIRYRQGELAGIIDIDSTPGNFDPNDSEVQAFIKECDFPANPDNPQYPAFEPDGSTLGKARHDKAMELFEDDADRAPGVILKVAPDERHITGNVFNDGANKDLLAKENGAKERLGDGKNNTSDSKYYADKNIEGVTVELLEEGKTTPVQTTVTDANGNYDITNFVPGKYKLIYRYGTVSGTLDKNKNGGNLYHGQDYKSTLYFDSNYQKDANGHAWWYINETPESDARDDFARRKEVNDNSRTIINYLAETLNGERPSELEDLAKMTANTNVLDVEVDYPIDGKYDPEQKNQGRYIVNEINFGIIERPRAELLLNEYITRIVIVSNAASTGVSNILIDATSENKVNGVAWKKNSYDQDTRTRNLGTINVTLDDSLRQGATMYIHYNLTAQNIGENNYIDNSGNELEEYYNEGTHPSNAKLAGLSAGALMNYVSDDLIFHQENNKNGEGKDLWKKLDKTEIDKRSDANTIKLNYVNSQIGSIKNYHTVLDGTDDNEIIGKVIVPSKDEIVVPLILQQTLSSNGDTDVKYRDTTEVVVQESEVGRRQYVVPNEPKEDHPNDVIPTIPGNLDPELVYDPLGASVDPAIRDWYVPKFSTFNEPDSAAGEPVTVIPPFGTNKNYIPMVIAGIVIVAIFGTGIYIIKKKIL